MQESVEGKAIADFWAWWPTVALALDQPLRAGTVSAELQDGLGRRIRDVHAKLDWGFGPGRQARHCLWVSARGDLGLRPYAERWLEAAVETDDLWEFRAARQPRTGGARELSTGEKNLRLAELKVKWSVSRSREVINLVVYHHQFDDMKEPHRAHAAFIALDDELGEDGVELWLGTVEIADQPLSGASPLADLRQVVAKLKQDATGEHWVSRQGDIDGAPLVVTVNRALKCAHHLMLNQHARVDVRLQEPNKLGLARKNEALALEKLEADLRDQLGDGAVFIGRETHQGHRVLHLHMADSIDAMNDLEAWKRSCAGREIAVLIQPDPHWEVLRRWG